MQPKSSVVIDEKAFQVMKRTMRNMAVPYRERVKTRNTVRRCLNRSASS